MQHRAIPSLAAPADAPISDLNTTPLIDVMLVLLIMFIVTIPLSTHKVPLDLPQGPTRVSAEPVIHRLSLDASGATTLDGAPLSWRDLQPRLAAIAAEPAAELQLHADGAARYERFDQLLAAIRRAGITRMGMVGNERHVAAIR
jgi:biopolymer transport protein ExbD